MQKRTDSSIETKTKTEKQKQKQLNIHTDRKTVRMTEKQANSKMLKDMIKSRKRRQ